MRRWLPICAAVFSFAVLLAAGAALRRRPPATADDATAATSPRAARPPFLPSVSGTDAPPPFARDPAARPRPPDDLVARVPDLMKSWREAIVTKNADTVVILDRGFAERPAVFIPALMVSAESDPEARVRSFSTRVLGKLRATESLAVLRRLLDDRSEYVRFNAAWALGELNDREAPSRLARLAARDPSPMVRESAGAARRKIEGG